MKDDQQEPVICVWSVDDSNCDGEIKKEVLLGGLSITICRKHYKDHKQIMALHEFSKIDLDEILKMSSKVREKALTDLDLIDKVDDIVG